MVCWYYVCQYSILYFDDNIGKSDALPVDCGGEDRRIYGCSLPEVVTGLTITSYYDIWCSNNHTDVIELIGWMLQRCWKVAKPTKVPRPTYTF